METGFKSLNEALKSFVGDSEFVKTVTKLGQELSSEMDSYYIEIDNMYDDYRYDHDAYDGLNRERALKSLREQVRSDIKHIQELFWARNYFFVFEEIKDYKLL